VRRVKSFLSAAENFYWGSGVAADVPALAYFLLISLAPFLLGVTAIAARLADTDKLIQSLAVRASDGLPSELQLSLVQVIAHAQRSSGWLMIIAVAGCLWTCSGAVGVVVRCQHRLLARNSFPPVIGRIREIGLAGLVLLLVVVLAALGAVAGGLVKQLNIDLSGLEAAGAAWAVTLSVLVLLYTLGPRHQVKLADALVAALPVSLALQLVPLIVGWYARHAVGAVNVAQLFFILVMLVIGCTLSAQLILSGACLSCLRTKGIKLRQLASTRLISEGKLH